MTPSTREKEAIVIIIKLKPITCVSWKFVPGTLLGAGTK